MKRILPLLSTLYSLLSTLSFAQPGTWAWMKGDSTFISEGSYGTMGVPHPSNYPPARYSPTRWTDAEGNFWIYGGYGPDQFLGDLWKYDANTNMWTWIFGKQSTNEVAMYGTQGVPSPSNFPGCRGWACASWTDTNGDLWLFAGKGYGTDPSKDVQLSDLWRYNIATNQWTWMKGNSNDFIHYGIKQQGDDDNTPGMRMEVTAHWTDSDNGLWFYGGLSNGTVQSDRSDMWRYNVSTNEWAWMSGDTVINVAPDLGMQYIFSPSNTPGARMSHCSWNDANGKFWFFGGKNNTVGEEWADLWQYDPNINQWAWMGGNIENTSGNAGDQCDTSIEFYPKGRWENRARWIDQCGNLWLFGGQKNSSALNDLWVYSTSLNTWSYVNGTLVTNDDGYYGTKGISDPANLPPGRMGAAAFTDTQGNFWLFAGSHTTNPATLYSDLWRYDPGPDCPASLYCNPLTVSISVNGPTTFCKGESVTLLATANDEVTYQWEKNGSEIPGATGNSYGATETGDYAVTASNPDGSVTSNIVSVTVNKKPKAVITPSGTVTICDGETVVLTANSGNNLTYQWKKNGSAISGATHSTYTASTAGKYKVMVTNVNTGCSKTSSATTVIISCRETEQNIEENPEVSVYPNPCAGIFTLELPEYLSSETISVKIFNALGQPVYSLEEGCPSACKNEIQWSNSSNGIYFIEIKTEDVFLRKKLLITK